MKLRSLVILLSLAFMPKAQAQVAVIANRSVSADQLDAGQLLDIFSLEETQWRDGSRIVLFEIKQSNEAKSAFYKFIGQRPGEMKRVRLRVILSGEGRSPTLLRSLEAVLQKVEETEGALGYIPVDLVSDDVKVVATFG